MTLLPLPSGKTINLDNVTYAERVTWQQSQPDGSIPTYDGIVIHFIGSSIVRLTGQDAATIAPAVGL